MPASLNTRAGFVFPDFLVLKGIRLAGGQDAFERVEAVGFGRKADGCQFSPIAAGFPSRAIVTQS